MIMFESLQDLQPRAYDQRAQHAFQLSGRLWRQILALRHATVELGHLGPDVFHGGAPQRSHTRLRVMTFPFQSSLVVSLR